MMSLEHFIRIRRLPAVETNFIYAYQDTPTFRTTFITKDVYACSILLCDHLPHESIESFTPTPSFRFNATYEEILDVCILPLSHR